MEAKILLIEPLLERAEEYGKTSFELLKFKTVYKTADVASTLISRVWLSIIVSLFVLTLNVGVALWIGDALGKNYYGFLIVALFYGFTGIVLYFMLPIMKERLHNSIVKHILN